MGRRDIFYKFLLLCHHLKVAVIAGNEGATQSDARRDGAKETFEDAGMEVVAVEQCDFDAQKAYDAAAAIIESNPDIV